MKVKCISKGGWIIKNDLVVKIFGFVVSKKDRNVNGPAKGDIVTVIKEIWIDGQLYYSLLEWPVREKYWAGYNAKNFRPLEEVYDKVKLEEIKEIASVN